MTKTTLLTINILADETQCSYYQDVVLIRDDFDFYTLEDAFARYVDSNACSDSYDDYAPDVLDAMRLDWEYFPQGGTYVDDYVSIWI